MLDHILDEILLAQLKTAPALGGIYSLGLLNDVLKEKNLPPVQRLTPWRF